VNGFARIELAETLSPGDILETDSVGRAVSDQGDDTRYDIGVLIFGGDPGDIRLMLIRPSASVLTADPGHIHTPVYASIFEDDSDCTTTINTGLAGTFVGWITASTSASNGMVIDLSDSSGDSITIPTTGEYDVGLTASLETLSGFFSFTASITVDGVQSSITNSYHMHVGTPSKIAITHRSIVSLTAGEKIRVEFDADNANEMIGVCNMSLVIMQVE
jgi:hypothetical protein